MTALGRRHAVDAPSRATPFASLPAGTTDSHAHVFDPSRFPFDEARRYTPGAAPVATLIAHLDRLGANRVVVVQPSVYGTDNRCLLDALATLGPARSRGVAVVDVDTVSDRQLAELEATGVCGIRLNLAVDHQTDSAVTAAWLARVAGIVNRPGWHLQLHLAAGVLPIVEQALASIDVPIVLDHFGGFGSGDLGEPLEHLLTLVETGRVFVKCSAPWRRSGQGPRHDDLAPLVRALAAARPDRLLWGSDWPYTGEGRDRRPDRIEPFREPDLATSLDALARWIGDRDVLDRILVDNPARLYGFEPVANGP